MVDHGGDIYAASRETGIPIGRIADFSASINPLGPPRSVTAAIKRHIRELRHYPDPAASALTDEIARSTGLCRESIVCGNGSTELIYLIVRALQPKRVLIPAPAFSEYEKAINVCRGASRCARMDFYPLLERNDFKLDADEFIDAMAGCDMAFLCNPNNPTGGIVSKADMSKIAGAAGESGCYLVVDESFIDFVPRESVVEKVKANHHLIVLRSLTKFFALSGLRIGYAVVNQDLIEPIRRCKEPWTVNTLAQVAGTAALKDAVYKRETLRVIKEEKEYLEKCFKLAGIRYYPSCANFYLLRMDNAPDMISRLRSKGILVRNCSNFRGLDGSYIRVAVRSRRENMRLIKELARS